MEFMNGFKQYVAELYYMEKDGIPSWGDSKNFIRRYNRLHN